MCIYILPERYILFVFSNGHRKTIRMWSLDAFPPNCSPSSDKQEDRQMLAWTMALDSVNALTSYCVSSFLRLLPRHQSDISTFQFTSEVPSWFVLSSLRGFAILMPRTNTYTVSGYVHLPLPTWPRAAGALGGTSRVPYCRSSLLRFQSSHRNSLLVMIIMISIPNTISLL